MNEVEFEWDAAKAASNVVKHGISFEAALRIFKDAVAYERIDLDSNPAEVRYAVTGQVNGIILTVVYTERCERIRIIQQEGQHHMSENITIAAKRLNDGALVQMLAGGATKPLQDKTDWDRLRALTDEEVTAAALADPDAQPASPQQLHTAQRTPRAKTIRRALGLTQEEFASRYHIPIGTLRDWEQGRSEPDQPARAYLAVIAHDPDRTQRALAAKQR